MQENKQLPNYYAIIPADVRYNKSLKASEKLLYAEITSLTKISGVCYASNNYFARLYNVTPQAISQWIKRLRELNYIVVDYIKENKQTKYRIIRIKGINKCEYLLTKNEDGYQQMFKENNKYNNNTDEYKEEIFDCDWLDEDEDTENDK